MQALSKRDIKQLNKDIERFGISFSVKDRLLKKDNVIIKDSKIMLICYNGKYFPSLHISSEMPIIVVDMGAIPFIIKGADLMKPGIKEMQDFEKDSFVKIIDEKNKKAIAIGIALYSSEDIKKMQKGKVVKILHYIGDVYFKM